MRRDFGLPSTQAGWPALWKGAALKPFENKRVPFTKGSPGVLATCLASAVESRGRGGLLPSRVDLQGGEEGRGYQAGGAVLPGQSGHGCGLWRYPPPGSEAAFREPRLTLRPGAYWAWP